MWWRRWSGGLGSWVLSGFTPRASQTSHVQLWPIELRAGSPTLAQAQLECCGNAVVVCVCVYVGKLWLTGGRLLSSAVGLSVTPPTGTPLPQPPHPPPTSPARALWPCMSSRSTLHKKCTKRCTHAQARAHTWLRSHRDAWTPCKKV